MSNSIITLATEGGSAAVTAHMNQIHMRMDKSMMHTWTHPRDTWGYQYKATLAVFPATSKAAVWIKKQVDEFGLDAKCDMSEEQVTEKLLNM
jgi:hypothetical protein